MSHPGRLITVTNPDGIDPPSQLREVMPQATIVRSAPQWWTALVPEVFLPQAAGWASQLGEVTHWDPGNGATAPFHYTLTPRWRVRIDWAARDQRFRPVWWLRWDHQGTNPPGIDYQRVLVVLPTPPLEVDYTIEHDNPGWTRIAEQLRSVPPTGSTPPRITRIVGECMGKAELKAL